MFHLYNPLCEPWGRVLPPAPPANAPWAPRAALGARLLPRLTHESPEQTQPSGSRRGRRPSQGDTPGQYTHTYIHILRQMCAELINQPDGLQSPPFSPADQSWDRKPDAQCRRGPAALLPHVCLGPPSPSGVSAKRLPASTALGAVGN